MEKGSMMPIKKILGSILILAGAGLIFFKDSSKILIPFLYSQKIVFGIILAVSGYFLFKSGRQL
jgi:hypothetical protein